MLRYKYSLNIQNIRKNGKQKPKRGHTIQVRFGGNEVHDSLSMEEDQGGGGGGAGPARSQSLAVANGGQSHPLVMGRKKAGSVLSLIAPQWIRQTIP